MASKRSARFANGAAEIARFGEVIDEHVTAAVLFYQRAELQYRDRFLGILGHDLQTPINAIRLNATLLSSELLEGTQLTTVSRLLNSTQHLTGMIEDLLDFARGRLGVPMLIKPTALDLRLVILNVIEEIQAAYPGSAIQLKTEGDPKGEWDARQVKANVV